MEWGNPRGFVKGASAISTGSVRRCSTKCHQCKSLDCITSFALMWSICRWETSIGVDLHGRQSFPPLVYNYPARRCRYYIIVVEVEPSKYLHLRMIWSPFRTKTIAQTLRRFNFRCIKVIPLPIDLSRWCWSSSTLMFFVITYNLRQWILSIGVAINLVTCWLEDKKMQRRNKERLKKNVNAYKASYT